ncbi:probable cytochrome P450 6a14 [Chironomus tepperi]|uniref:probable cytochrome P450 6a14 n=1 Tax=Chironomus tepperi TaxID=113505 RepID=UPI00391F0E5B
MNTYIFISFIATIIYLLNKYFFSYWTRRDVYQVEPTFLVGNVGKLFTLKAHMADIFTDIYFKHKNKRFLGGYMSYRPMLIVHDPVLFQDIMIRDFTTFHDRPTPGEVADAHPLVGNLVNLKGQKWKNIRTKLSPTFTSGKLKAMFPIMRDCCKVLQDYTEKNIKNGRNVVDLKDLLARLTINIISSVGFGVENDCINEPDNDFRKMGLKLFAPSLRNGVINVLVFFTPDIVTRFKINPFPADVTEFMFSVVNQTVEYREKNNYQRNDFMQLLIELKNKGYVSADKKDEHEIEWMTENEDTKFTMNELTAQAFVFFGAGFETSSSTMSFCMFELARNKDIQRKVQEEIDRVMASAGPEGVTYELLAEMKYLDCCIDETLRKYPILPVILRLTTKDYKISGSDVVIEKNTPVFIPIIGMQRDPEIYENPMQFKPERFMNSSNGNANISSGIVYAPFGDGPRNCIGGRLGKLQTKLGLVTILQKFNFELQDKTLEYGELKFHPNSFVLSPKETVMYKVSLRK